METVTIPARDVSTGATIVDESGHRMTVTKVHTAYGLVVILGLCRYWGRMQGMNLAPDAPVRVRVVRDGEW